MKKFVALLLLALPSAGFAQNFLQFSPFSIQNYGGRIINENIRDELNKSTFESDSDESNLDYVTNSDISLSYSPSKSRTRANLQNFVKKTRTTDPVGAAQMEQLFGSNDIIGQIDGAMRGKGLSASNAADAYAVWWVSAWQAANADTRDFGGSTYQAVSAQAARGFAATTQFASATDAQKQEMAEAMLIQAALIDASKETYVGDPEQMRALSKAVKQGAATSGLDLDKMKLTDDGFLSVGRK